MYINAGCPDILLCKYIFMKCNKIVYFSSCIKLNLDLTETSQYTNVPVVLRV